MTSPRRRADATEHRGRIIDAAQALVMSSDDLRLNEVAKRAGVGQGTLYRHFPTREDLLAEVYRHDVDELIAVAPALLAEHRPLEALTLWFRRVADGTIRPDVDARDVILLISFLSHIEEAEADERAHHVLELILDGLRRRADDS